jgi:arginase family enzyme
MKIIAFPTSLGTLGKYDEVEKGPESVLKDIDHITIKPTVSNQEEYLDQIHVEAEKYDALVAVGGDHSISYPLAFAFKKKYPDGKIVIFDAHPDCEVHTETPTHEDWIRMLIEAGIVKPEEVYFIGTRKITSREREFMREHGIKIYKNLPEVDGPIYLSIDIDVLDPNECRGFHFKEKNGMKADDLLSMIKSLKPEVKFADIVEIFPDKKTAVIVREIISILI